MLLAVLTFGTAVLATGYLVVLWRRGTVDRKLALQGGTTWWEMASIALATYLLVTAMMLIQGWPAVIDLFVVYTAVTVGLLGALMLVFRHRHSS